MNGLPVERVAPKGLLNVLNGPFERLYQALKRCVKVCRPHEALKSLIIYKIIVRGPRDSSKAGAAD